MISEILTVLLQAASIVVVVLTYLPTMLSRSIITIVLALCPCDVVSSTSLLPGEVSMGTTILAVRYNGGIVVGADT